MSTEYYKQSHRPKVPKDDRKGKPHEGIYIPAHPEKVIGGDVIFRSGWERLYARWCDDNPAVVQWGTEVIAIPYRNPAAVNISECKKYGVDHTNPYNWPVNNYYPDFYVVMRLDDGRYQRWLIEIKPYYQTIQPVVPDSKAKLREVKRFNSEVRTFIENKEKWKAAEQWCASQRDPVIFKKITEIELHEMGLL